MTTYPDKVLRNNATENMPFQWRPVDDSQWNTFGTKADCERGFGMIDAITDNAVMEDCTGSECGQYQSFDQPDPDVWVRIVRAKAKDDQGDMVILEYPSDILDRDTTPLGMVDKYGPGQPHVLKVLRITPNQGLVPGRGMLYWDVA